VDYRNLPYRTDQFLAGSRRSTGTVKTQRIESCAMSLGLPPLVRSGVFFVFFNISRGGAEQSLFCCVFRSFPKVGNSRLKTRFHCLSLYGKRCGNLKIMFTRQRCIKLET